MAEGVRKILGLFAGEGRKTLLFALLGYLWLLAVTTGDHMSDVLFLTHVGAESLPTIYGVTACAMMLLSFCLIRLLHRTAPEKIVRNLLLITIGFYAGASWWCSWHVLKVFGYFFYPIAITGYWVFVDQYHCINRAKRIYCLLSAALFLGNASSGALLRTIGVHLPSCIACIVLSLLGALFFLQRIKTEAAVVEEIDEEERAKGQGFGSFVRAITRSPFTWVLMLHCFTIELYAWSMEYSYFSFFESYFGHTEEGIAQFSRFFGQVIVVVGICNLLFALFCYNRLVQRFGPCSLIPVSALLLIFTCTGWLLRPSLLFPVMGYYVVEGTRWVIDDSTFNLLLVAVPLHLRYQVRILIEHFFEPVAMLASGLLLFSVDSKILSLGLGILSLGLAFSLRRLYSQPSSERIWIGELDQPLKDAV